MTTRLTAVDGNISILPRKKQKRVILKEIYHQVGCLILGGSNENAATDRVDHHLFGMGSLGVRYLQGCKSC